MSFLFTQLDKAIYMFAGIAYQVFQHLAEMRLFDDGAIVQALMQRIYAIVGIIMLFVLTFNILNYIIDPNKINDKKIGASASIKNIVIALILVTLLPTIFTKLYQFQGVVLGSGFISNLVMGGGAEETTDELYTRMLSEGKISPDTTFAKFRIDNGANIMIANVFATFYTPIEDGSEQFTVLDCSDKEKRNLQPDYCDAYDDARISGKITAFTKLGVKKYDYHFFLSTFGGIVLLFFMASFCLNMAMRAGKLAILQFMAPIPILMEIIPSKQGTRKTWTTSLMSTYLEVFAYLLVVYLIVFLITLIPNVISNIIPSGGMVGMLATVMLIFGLLSFGKEAPKLIFDLLGIKSTGTIAAAAKRAMAMAGFTGNAATSIPINYMKGRSAAMDNMFKKWKEDNEEILKDADGNDLSDEVQWDMFRRSLNPRGSRFNPLAGVKTGIINAASGLGTMVLGAKDVHSVKDAKDLARKSSELAFAKTLSRHADYIDAERDLYEYAIRRRDHMYEEFQNKSYDVLGTAIGPGADKRNSQFRKEKYENVASELNKLYTELEGSAYKNDSLYQRYHNNVEELEAHLKLAKQDQSYTCVYGGVELDMAGIERELENNKILENERKIKKIKDNKVKIMEQVGKINNYVKNNYAYAPTDIYGEIFRDSKLLGDIELVKSNGALNETVLNNIIDKLDERDKVIKTEENALRASVHFDNQILGLLPDSIKNDYIDVSTGTMKSDTNPKTLYNTIQVEIENRDKEVGYASKKAANSNERQRKLKTDIETINAQKNSEEQAIEDLNNQIYEVENQYKNEVGLTPILDEAYLSKKQEVEQKINSMREQIKIKNETIDNLNNQIADATREFNIEVGAYNLAISKQQSLIDEVQAIENFVERNFDLTDLNHAIDEKNIIVDGLDRYMDHLESHVKKGKMVYINQTNYDPNIETDRAIINANEGAGINVVIGGKAKKEDLENDSEYVAEKIRLANKKDNKEALEKAIQKAQEKKSDDKK